MEEQNDSPLPRSRVRRRSNPFGYLALVVVIGSLVAFYFYRQYYPATALRTDAENSVPAKTADQPPGLQSVPIEELHLADKDEGAEPAPGSWREALSQPGTPAESDQPSAADADPQQLIEEINNFYVHLDQQPYMQNLVQSFGLKEPSKVYFSKLAQRLADNPPVVFRETDDLYTLLKNTAHFFRVLGKDNVTILKGILAGEQNSIEHILKNLYNLTDHPDYLKKEYSLSLPPDALSDYGAFFLNTMGGRLYLFRRESTLRMVVSYYAIVTMDRANQEGSGKYGIDLRPAIQALIEEMETGGGRLQLKEEYLDTLDRLQEKYSSQR